MFKFPPLNSLFIRFSGIAIDENHEGRTSGGYTFRPDEHERGESGKFEFQGGPKPYVKENGEASEQNKKTPIKESSKPQKNPEIKESKKFDENKDFNLKYTDISEEAKKTIKKYQSESKNAVALNQAIIDGSITEKQQKQIDLIDEAISKSTLEKDALLFRGLSISEEVKDSPKTKAYFDLLNNSSPGDIIDNVSYTSTSINESKGYIYSNRGGFNGERIDDPSKGLIFKIVAPKGSNALYVDKVAGTQNSMLSSEGEVLLPRNSKFEIESIDREKGIINLILRKNEETSAEIPDIPQIPTKDYFTAESGKVEHSGDVSKVNHYRNFPEMLGKPKKEEVKISDLHPTQDYVYTKGIKEKLNESSIKPVTVIKLPNGHLMLEDGHHRTVASMLRGDKTIKAKVYEPTEE